MNKNAVERYFKKDELIIIFLYSLAHGLMLLNEGVFLDDWTLYGANVQEIAVTFGKDMGGDLFVYNVIHQLFHNYPIIYRFIVFFSFLFSSLLFNAILRKTEGIDKLERLVLVLFFCLYPVNFAKISMITTPYFVCMLFFLLGVYFFQKYITTGKKISWGTSVLFFIISYQMKAFLSLYLVVVFLLITFHEVKLEKKLKCFKKYIVFILMPFTYYLLYKFFFAPTGHYDGVYDLGFQNILLSPFHIVFSSYNNLVKPVIPSGLDSYSMSLYFVFALGIFLFLNNQLRELEYRNKDTDKIFIIVGVIIYIFSVFPYIAIKGNGLNFGYEWETRNQLLVPFGASFIIFFGAKWLFLRVLCFKNFKLVISILIVSFVISNIDTYLRHQRSWHKSLAIVGAFKKEEIIRSNNTFLIDDKTLHLNALDEEQFRFYAWTGMMKMAFGDEKRFAIGTYYKECCTPAQDSWEFGSSMRSLADYDELASPQYLITIKPTTSIITLKGTLMTLLLKWIDYSKFENRLRRILTLEIKKIESSQL